MIFQYSSIITAEFQSKVLTDNICCAQVISNFIFKTGKMRKS